MLFASQSSPGINVPKKKSTAKKPAAPRSKASQPAGNRKRKKVAAATTAIRLQKFLAQAGYGSRRECEELVAEGRVTVDGQVVSKLGSRVEPDCTKVRVDGTKVMPVKQQYFMVHKPTGVLSTCRDPEGRMRVIDLIKTDQRVYNVGRLDKSSEGLILVTNDGDLANRLTHPRYGVEKTYHVTVAGNPRWEDLEQLKRGIRLAEAVARVSDVKIKKRHRDVCELVMVLQEGRNREIRRLLAHIGHKVIRLRRVAIGPLHLGTLKAGDYRRLEPREIEALRKASAVVTGKRARKSRPVETSQLSGSKKKKAAAAKKKSATGKPTAARTGSKSVGSKSAGTKSSSKPSTRAGVKSKKKTAKKKRTPTTKSRRGAGRMSPADARKKNSSGGKKKVHKKRTGKKKTARPTKGSGSRVSSRKRSKRR